MEHIWQSSQKHTPSPFDVAKDRTNFRSVAQARAIRVFPGLEKREELVPVFCGADAGDFEKDLPKLPGVCGLGVAAAPGQSLPLDMDQTSLHHDIRPEFTENLHHLGITVDGEATRTQFTQRFKEPYHLRLRAFRDPVSTSNQRVGVGVHQGNEAARPMEKSSVQDEMRALRHVQGKRRRCLFQVMIDHTIKLPRAMPALAGQLSDRIAFDNPASEPFQFVCFSSLGITPTEGAPA